MIIALVWIHDTELLAPQRLTDDFAYQAQAHDNCARSRDAVDHHRVALFKQDSYLFSGCSVRCLRLRVAPYNSYKVNRALLVVKHVLHRKSVSEASHCELYTFVSNHGVKPDLRP